MGQFDKFLAKMHQEGVTSAIMSVARFALRKLAIAGYEPPYEYVQKDVQRNLHRYLRTNRSKVRDIIIVGTHLGHEVPSMLRRYPDLRFRLFEASPRYIGALRRRFASERRVLVYECAVTDSDGSKTFFETNLDGSGSLLRVADLARVSYGMRQAETYKVAAVRLDTHAYDNGYQHDTIDCLWIDVQGAEMEVLRGAVKTLAHTRSVFVEISVFRPVYEGGSLFEEIEQHLMNHGFRAVSIGTDAGNGTGNAFFIRRPQARSAQ